MRKCGVSPTPAKEIFGDDLRKRGDDRLLRLQRGGSLGIDRHRCVLCRARPCGTRNRRQGPDSPGMVERRRHCDGHRHLGDAYQGDAGLPLACTRRVPLADISGVPPGGHPRVRGRVICSEPPENRLGSGFDRQRHYGRRHRRHALHGDGRNEITCHGPVFPPASDHFCFVRVHLFSGSAADGIRSARGDPMDCPAKAGQRYGDGSRCLRDALHGHGCRKFHTHLASGPFPRCEHLPPGQQRNRHGDFDRACGRHSDIVRGQAGGCGSPAAQPGVGASRGRAGARA